MGVFLGMLFFFLQLSLNAYRTLAVFPAIAGEFSPGWFRPVGNVREILLPSTKHKARFGPAFSHSPGNALLLVGSQEENLRAAADKSAITRSRANVDGVHQHPNPPKIGNTIPAAGKQGEPDILDKALQVVNKELS